MDSGSAVPTISPGFNETVAAKLLTTARGRWSGALAGSPASSGCETVFPVGPSELMRIRCARFLGADNPTSGDPINLLVVVGLLCNSGLDRKSTRLNSSH